MNLIRYNPNRWFDFPFDRIFDEFLPRIGGRNLGVERTESAHFAPRVDISEEKEALLVSAELPGVEKDKVSVEVDDGVLTLSAEKLAERKENEGGFYRSERVFGNFKRSFEVPASVDAGNISAEYANGVLKVTLPKRPEAAPRQIEIKAENGAAKQIETQ